MDAPVTTWEHGAMSSPSYRPRQQAQQGWSPGPAPAPGPYGEAPLTGTPVMAPDHQRLWATLGHLSPLVTSLFGPLVLFLVLKDRGSFVRHHSAEALNLQITLTLLSLGGTVVGIALAVVTFGLAGIVVVPAAALLGVVVVVLQVLAAARAHQGLDCRYPFTLRVVR